MTTLFDPLRLGELDLPNRIVMAPLTRRRTDHRRAGTPLMAEYYAQRASAGLIIAEATSISPFGVGHELTPGIWTSEQTEGWQLVTTAVHNAGGRIFLQLWHVGRISDPFFHNGQLPVAPSPIAAEGHPSLLRPLRPYAVPRALDIDEIPKMVGEYRAAAENALRAGFDGVELHGANGYLPDQFLRDATNARSDEYGGSVPNRARFMLEVLDALISVWGGGRVGLRLSPQGTVHSMSDSDPATTFGYVANQIRKRELAFLCVREAITGMRFGPKLREAFGGVYIANEGLTKASASQLLSAGEADAAAFGRLFIANPDLPRRFLLDAPLVDADPDLYYTQSATGYSDYPAHSQ